MSRSASASKARRRSSAPSRRLGQAGTQAFGQVDRALEKTGSRDRSRDRPVQAPGGSRRMAAQADARRGGSIRFWASTDRRRVRRARRPRSSNRPRGKRNAMRPAPGLCARRLIRSPRAGPAQCELAEHAALASRGAITTAEQAAANALAKSRFDQTAQAIKGVGANSKLTTQQVMTLQYTVNDVIASMSTGMSPMTIPDAAGWTGDAGLRRLARHDHDARLRHRRCRRRHRGRRRLRWRAHGGVVRQ